MSTAQTQTGRGAEGCEAARGGKAAERAPSLWYLSKAEIDDSPSRAYFLRKYNSVDQAREKEQSSRRLTCAFLQESGQKLRLPQLSIATAIVFFHRFYSKMSYEHYDRFTVATTCLFLASKVEETPKKLRDVVSETYKVHHGAEKAPDPDSKEFFELKEKILVCERILLQALHFDLSVEHAYRPLLAYVKSIQGTRDLAQIAWNFINDSLRTTICLQHAPRCLAAASAHLAAKYLATHTKRDFKLPDNPQGGKWYSSFQVSEDVIEDIAKQILAMYGEKGQPTAPFLSGDALKRMSRDGAGSVTPDHPSNGGEPAVKAEPAASAKVAATREPLPGVVEDAAGEGSLHGGVKVEPQIKAEQDAAVQWEQGAIAETEQGAAVKVEQGVAAEGDPSTLELAPSQASKSQASTAAPAPGPGSVKREHDVALGSSASSTKRSKEGAAA